MNITNVAKGKCNELHVLQAIGQTGWLSTTQVARWVWGEKNSRSARVSADRVLKRLVERREIKRRDSSLKMCVYILTKAGAARANEGLKYELFRHGYDLSQLDFARQRPAVDYLIRQHHAGKIVLGKAGLRKAIEIELFDKKAFAGADGLVLDKEAGEFKGVLVIRNVHPELVKKAKRIKNAVGELELVGNAGLIKCFRQAMKT